MEGVKIVVSDTNILIDLVRLGYLDVLFKLGWEVTTTDFVIEEILDDSQRKAIDHYVQAGALTVRTYTSKESFELAKFHLSVSSTSNLTLQDCSVLRYSKEIGAVLLSGDKKLRSKAEEENITVRGIIYIFDKAVEQNVLQKEETADVLAKLLVLNPRLPKKEILQRITNLRDNKNNMS